MFSLFVSFLFIFVYGLPSVSADCLTCCASGVGCSTAYNGEAGKCCTGYYLPVCCPSGTTCRSDGTCHNDFYLGNLTLVELIVVICAVIGGIIILTAITSCICRSRTRTIIAPTPYVPPMNNPTVHYVLPANSY